MVMLFNERMSQETLKKYDLSNPPQHEIYNKKIASKQVFGFKKELI